MDLALLVYAISLLKGIQGALNLVTTLTLLTITASLFLMLQMWLGGKEQPPQLVKTAKIALGLFISFGTLSIFIPTEKTAYMMTAAYATQQIAEKPETKQITDKVMKIINAKLDSYIDDVNKK
jgi:hypothetical protein